MSKRGQAVHVAAAIRSRKGQVETSCLSGRTYREDAKVRHGTLGDLSHLLLPIVDMVREALRGETHV